MEALPVIVDDHLLWPDGTISVDPDKVISYIYKLKNGDVTNLFVNEMTDEIKSYNLLSDHKITVKDSCALRPINWVLPDKYLKFDLDEYLLDLSTRIEKDSLYDARVNRLCQEICLFKELNLEEVLRTLIYVIDVMTEKNVVWGVGRGSSCSSYLLYLLGLHEVDPVKYEIEISDFLR
jgi:DNA polymerase III alpha subunit